MHIWLDNFNTYEDALMKALQIEMDEDYPINPVDQRIEEQLRSMLKSIREMSLRGNEVWCKKWSTVGHTKDYYQQDDRQQDDHWQDIRSVQKKKFVTSSKSMIYVQQKVRSSNNSCPYSKLLMQDISPPKILKQILRSRHKKYENMIKDSNTCWAN